MSKPPKDPRIGELVGIARELAEALGFEAAEALMLHFGGQRINVPTRMRPRSVLWKVLGREAALKLAEIAAQPRPGGGAADRQVDIPLGSRLLMARRKAAIAAFKGSKNQAAAQFGVHRRTVQRLRKGRRVIGPLFDGASNEG